MAVKTKKKEVAVVKGGGEAFSVQMIPLDSISPAKGNTKTHTDKQIDDIIRSIQEFGFNDPIALDQNYEIIAGHGRRMALLKMGATQAPCIVLDKLNPQQVRAYRIAHNKLTLDTGFDLGMLVSELSDLNMEGFDINCTGFTTDDLVNLDFTPETKAETSTKAPEAKEKLDGTAGVDDTDFESEVKEKAPQKSIVQYILIFEDEPQQQKFYEFLKYTRDNCEGETVAARMLDYIDSTMAFHPGKEE